MHKFHVELTREEAAAAARRLLRRDAGSAAASVLRGRPLQSADFDLTPSDTLVTTSGNRQTISRPVGLSSLIARTQQRLSVLIQGRIGLRRDLR
jgi:hypothetical protein